MTPSPCGANCSYSTTFDGPYFICNTSTANSTFSNRSFFNQWPSPIYNESSSFSASENFADSSKNLSNSAFLVTNWSPVALNVNGSMNLLLATQHNLTCMPYRAQYALLNRYENFVQNMEITTTSLQHIVSFNDANLSSIIQAFEFPTVQKVYPLISIQLCPLIGPASACNGTGT